MKTPLKIILPMALMTALPFQGISEAIQPENVDISVAGDFLSISAGFMLDSLKLGGNSQLFITPVVTEGDSMRTELPSILVNGRKMHISYERGVLRRFPQFRNHLVGKEVERKNGESQTIGYSARIPLEDWMRNAGANVSFVVDTCGCGALVGQGIGQSYPVVPIIDVPVQVKEMQAIMIKPTFSEPPVDVHHGKARVQFEVNRTELHAEPYTCRNGQVIDNRSQLAVIDDSVKYALTDPNVELAGISICGYASPESPYTHNQELATERSRALAEYLAERYQLPIEKVTYSAVAENWEEFRKEVESSPELTDRQRQDLLQLIDAPAATPAEYDRKERILKTDPRFSKLYKTKILPEWFPRLRATTFAVQTQLKPMTDDELVKIIATTPEKMSLAQMFRVARLYPQGSKEFNAAIATALRVYPDDPVAILNAAAAEVAQGEYAKAKLLLVKAGDSPEVFNLLGIIATSEGDYSLARDYFEKAGDLPEARRNLNLLPKE